jgi:hypothetical protein
MKPTILLTALSPAAALRVNARARMGGGIVVAYTTSKPPRH